MRIGSATHRLVLGDGPGKRIVRYDGDRRGKAWQEFAAAHADADKPDALCGKVRFAPLRVGKMRIAAIDDKVALRKVRHEA